MRKRTPLRTLPTAIVPARLAQVAAGVARAGFLDSAPSDANRTIERHELPGNQG